MHLCLADAPEEIELQTTAYLKWLKCKTQSGIVLKVARPRTGSQPSVSSPLRSIRGTRPPIWVGIFLRVRTQGTEVQRRPTHGRQPAWSWHCRQWRDKSDAALKKGKAGDYAGLLSLDTGASTSVVTGGGYFAGDAFHPLTLRW